MNKINKYIYLTRPRIIIPRISLAQTPGLRDLPHHPAPSTPPGNLFKRQKAKANPGLFTLHTSSSPLCRCTARKTWSPSRGSNNKYFPMQETQCDKFGVSGGLGEPRFGLKLWLGSADLIDDNSSKSWVLFRDLPYLAIVMGVDLCMFMSVGSHTTNKKNPLEG